MYDKAATNIAIFGRVSNKNNEDPEGPMEAGNRGVQRLSSIWLCGYNGKQRVIKHADAKRLEKGAESIPTEDEGNPPHSHLFFTSAVELVRHFLKLEENKRLTKYLTSFQKLQGKKSGFGRGKPRRRAKFILEEEWTDGIIRRGCVESHWRIFEMARVSVWA